MAGHDTTVGADDPTEPTEQQPVLRIVTPDATPEEIAALVTVFSALASSGDSPPRRPTRTWSDPARGVRPAHRHGVGAWRASGLPR